MKNDKRVLIEFGSNMAKIMSADSKDMKNENLQRLPLRLATLMDDSGKMSEKGILAILNLIGDTKIRNADAQEFILVGTEALRRASNQQEIRARVKQDYGLDLRVLSPQEEADAAYRGMKHLISKGKRAVCFDIGGSSIELVKVYGNRIESMLSFPMGAVDLYHDQVHGMPISNCAYTGLRLQIEKTLRWKVPSECNLIGSGGSVHTCAKVAMMNAGIDSSNIEGYRITKGELLRQSQVYRALDIDGIIKIPGMDPSRADIILPAVMIMRHLLDQTGQPYFVASRRGVRHGVFLKEIEKGSRT